MAGVGLTNDVYTSFTANHFAVLANSFYAGANFHRKKPFKAEIRDFSKPNSIGVSTGKRQGLKPKGFDDIYRNQCPADPPLQKVEFALKVDQIGQHVAHQVHMKP